MFFFGKKSKNKMVPAHSDLKKVLNRALEISFEEYGVDFGISEVKRSLQKQKKNLESGASKTLKSRHIADKNGVVYGVDLYAYVKGKASYKPKHLRCIAKAMFKAAIELGVDLEWGGHWSGFGVYGDMPHWQLAWETYPAA